LTTYRTQVTVPLQVPPGFENVGEHAKVNVPAAVPPLSPPVASSWTLAVEFVAQWSHENVPAPWTRTPVSAAADDGIASMDRNAASSSARRMMEPPP
jgi:hypothetical protein